MPFGTVDPLVVRSDEIETIGAGADLVRLLLDGTPEDPRSLSVVGSSLGRGSAGPPPHHHRASSEIFYILDGGMHVLAGDTVQTIAAGDLLVVPPGTTHAFTALPDTFRDARPS